MSRDSDIVVTLGADGEETAAAGGVVDLGPELPPVDEEPAELPAGAVQNDDGSVTLTLRYPKEIQIRNGAGKTRTERYDTLTFHRLTGADLNAVRATADQHQQRVLFTRSTRMQGPLMQALYERLDGKDIARAGQVLESFF